MEEIIANSPLGHCDTKLIDQLTLSLDHGNDPTGLIDDYGMQSVVFQPLRDLTYATSMQRLDYGVDSALNLLQGGVATICGDPTYRNIVLHLQPGDPDYFDPTATYPGQPPRTQPRSTSPSPTIARPIPTTTSTTDPASVVFDDDSNAPWWASAPQPAPDFLTAIVDQWATTVPPTPDACRLIGSIAAPADWGIAGDVTLTTDPNGGWLLQWPGPYDEHIRILTTTDLAHHPDLNQQTNTTGTSDNDATYWTTETSTIVRPTNTNCWYEYGTNSDAPAGLQRAFSAGIRYLQTITDNSTPPTPTTPPSTTPSTRAPVTSTTCPIGGIDTIKRGEGIPTACPSIITLQQDLNDRGYPVDIDGHFGAGTEAAVRQFQTDTHITADGQVGLVTWEYLHNS